MAISFKNVGFKSSDRRFRVNLTQPIPIGIKTPLELGYGKSSLFKMHYEPPTQLSDNLRILIVTNYGDRLGRYDFGANLGSLVFDLSDTASFEQAAAFNIKEAVDKFMPMIELINMSVSPVDKATDDGVAPAGMALVEIFITYNVPAARIVGNKLNVVMYVGG